LAASGYLKLNKGVAPDLEQSRSANTKFVPNTLAGNGLFGVYQQLIAEAPAEVRTAEEALGCAGRLKKDHGVHGQSGMGREPFVMPNIHPQTTPVFIPA
jgi:hypothetical protein